MSVKTCETQVFNVTTSTLAISKTRDVSKYHNKLYSMFVQAREKGDISKSILSYAANGCNWKRRGRGSPAPPRISHTQYNSDEGNNAYTDTRSDTGGESGYWILRGCHVRGRVRRHECNWQKLKGCRIFHGSYIFFGAIVRIRGEEEK